MEQLDWRSPPGQFGGKSIHQLTDSLHEFSQHRSKEKLIFRTLQINVFFLLFKDGNSF
jgi:hypothetical protein